MARSLDRILHEHWLRGDAGYSNVAVARYCGVDEKTVRQWRDGEKPMPAGALLVMPDEIVREVLDVVAKARGRKPKHGPTLLNEALDRCETAVLPMADRPEFLRVLLDAQTRINDMLKKLLQEGKR